MYIFSDHQVDDEHRTQWDPDSVSPAYLGVFNPVDGQATVLRDDGTEGILVYEGSVLRLVVTSQTSITVWTGRCTNGDGRISAVFGLRK